MYQKNICNLVIHHHFYSRFSHSGCKFEIQIVFTKLYKSNKLYQIIKNINKILLKKVSLILFLTNKIMIPC